MSLQIDYVIYLANIMNKVNIIYWFLIKYKRISHMILAIELQRMRNEFDIRVIIKATLRKMLGFAISLILCINEKSLYICLVK